MQAFIRNWVHINKQSVIKDASPLLSFNEPADMGGLRDGWGGGFTDDGLRPGSTSYGEWSIFSKDGKKVLIAYPYEVAFDDGTKWELNL